MKWDVVKLGDYCTITSSKRCYFSQRVDQGIPFYRSKEIIQIYNGQEVTECDYISLDQYSQIKEKFGVPQAGDLLLTTRGTIGIPYIYKGNDRFYFADGNLTWMKDFSEQLFQQFLYYWFISYEGASKIDSIAVGAAQKAVPISGLKNMQIPLPPLSVQRRIADILSAYDDLIENNQKQIKLLEEAAMRLYKEWFVYLRFPGHENTPIVDGVPEGWETGRFEDLCTLIKETVKVKDLNIDMPYIGLEHMPRKSICLNEWSDASTVNSNKFQFKENDILFGKIRPYFHKVGFAITNGVASTDAMVFRAKDDMFGLALMTAFSDLFVKHTSTACKEGAKMPRADWNEMKNYGVLIPDQPVLKEYDRQIQSLCSNIKVLCQQVKLLKQARDKLLPKLMSGEIEV